VTVRAFVNPTDPTTIDLHNKIDPRHAVRYLGRAWRDVATGRWLCLADVGALCVVEVRLIINGESEASPHAPGRAPLFVVVREEIPA
jgi:hypothetical protein